MRGSGDRGPATRTGRAPAEGAQTQPIHDENGPAAGQPPSAGPHFEKLMRRSGRRDVPDVVAVVARGVARLLVVLPEVERLALVGPLLAAVIAGDHGPRPGGLGVGRGHQRRPVGGAIAVAARLTGGGIAIVNVERHALGIDQRLALCGIAEFGGLLRQRDTRR